MKDDRFTVIFSQSVMIRHESPDSLTNANEFLNWQIQCPIHAFDVTVAISGSSDNPKNVTISVRNNHAELFDTCEQESQDFSRSTEKEVVDEEPGDCVRIGRVSLQGAFENPILLVFSKPSAKVIYWLWEAFHIRRGGAWQVIENRSNGEVLKASLL